MIGALWTGISGLSSHQKALDNESNNIANVHTVGYKSSRISFADQMYLRLLYYYQLHPSLSDVSLIRKHQSKVISS